MLTYDQKEKGNVYKWLSIVFILYNYLQERTSSTEQSNINGLLFTFFVCVRLLSVKEFFNI